MDAMIAVGGIIVLLSIVFVLLLVITLVSRRFRGAAVGLMLMSLVGGTVFLVFTYLMASRQHSLQRAQVERLRADMARQQLIAESALADQYREGIVLDDQLDAAAESPSALPESAEVSNDQEMVIEVQSEDDETVQEVTETVEEDPESPAADGEASEQSDTAPTDTAPTDTATATQTRDDRGARADEKGQTGSPTVPELYQVERPSWVSTPPKMVNGFPAEVIVSDAYVTGDECEENLRERIAAAIRRYASQTSRDAGGPRSVAIHVSGDDIRRVSRDRHLEIVQTSVGPMKQIHQLIVFDNTFKRRAKEQVARAVVGTRLAATGVVSGGALVLLATSFGLLRIISRSSQDA